MAIRTITVGSGSGVDYGEGWHECLMSKAQYGEYKGKRFIDIWFEGYPDNFNARVFETLNSSTKEEFRIANWFRFSNSGVQEVLEGKNTLITYDDDASFLNGMPINVFFYKEESDAGTFSRPWRDPAPTIMEAEHQTYTEKDVDYWKKRAESGYKSWTQLNGSGTASQKTDSIIEAIKAGDKAAASNVPF